MSGSRKTLESHVSIWYRRVAISAGPGSKDFSQQSMRLRLEGETTSQLRSELHVAESQRFKVRIPRIPAKVNLHTLPYWERVLAIAMHGYTP